MSTRPAAAQLQRSCCMALRNMAARTPELRAVILDRWVALSWMEGLGVG